MIVTLCNGKGGVGKSTVSVLLTLLLDHIGVEAGLHDRDPQGTATFWLQNLEKSPADPAKQYDHQVIDTPPQLNSPLFTTSVSQADRVVIVCSPSPTDLWTTKDTVETVEGVKKPDADVFLLFNKVRNGTTLAKGIDALAEQIGVSKLPGHLSDRQSYQHAALFGIEGLNTEALDELSEIGKSIFLS